MNDAANEFDGIEITPIDEPVTNPASKHYFSYGAFTMSDDGLIVSVVKGKGKAREIIEIFVCSAFEILSMVRAPDSSDWGLHLSWIDHDHKRHSQILSSGMLHGDASAVAATLAGGGLIVSRDQTRHLMSYLAEAVVATRSVQCETTGWQGDDFVLPSETFSKANKAEKVVLSSTAVTSAYTQKGSLENWKASVAAPAGEHSLTAYALAFAFVGPLLRFADGAAGSNFVGPSSMGKTSLLAIAASVWGYGGEGAGSFIKSWRATANSLEAVASMANDTMLLLDEMGVGEAKEISAAIYQLANGVGKGRARRDGSARQSKQWRVPYLSSSEVGVTSKLESEGRGGRARVGQQVRLPDIPVTHESEFGAFNNATSKDDACAIADAFKAAIRENYGWAGPAFIRRLVAEQDIEAKVKPLVDTWISTYVAPGVDGQVARTAKRFALAAVAGEMAADYKILPWTLGTASAAAAFAFKAWLSQRGTTGSGEAEISVNRIRSMIAQFGGSRFENVDIAPMAPIQNRLGWIGKVHGEPCFLIISSVWNSQFCAGDDPATVARHLRDAGFLISGGDKPRLQVKVRIDGEPTWVYAVSKRIVAGLRDDAASDGDDAEDKVATDE